MTRRQKEIPGTRLDSETKLQEPIKDLDDACDALEKAKGKVSRAQQGVVVAKKTAQDLLDEHGREEYEYETSDGKLKKIFRKRTLGSCKVKVVKRTDAATDDGDDE